MRQARFQISVMMGATCTCQSLALGMEAFDSGTAPRQAPLVYTRVQSPPTRVMAFCSGLYFHYVR